MRRNDVNINEKYLNTTLLIVMFLHLHYFMSGNILIKHNGRGSYFSGEEKNPFSVEDIMKNRDILI